MIDYTWTWHWRNIEQASFGVELLVTENQMYKKRLLSQPWIFQKNPQPCFHALLFICITSFRAGEITSPVMLCNPLVMILSTWGGKLFIMFAVLLQTVEKKYKSSCMCDQTRYEMNLWKWSDMTTLITSQPVGHRQDNYLFFFIIPLLYYNIVTSQWHYHMLLLLQTILFIWSARHCQASFYRHWIECRHRYLDHFLLQTFF